MAGLYRADVAAIAKIRARLGWSQRKLANAVGVHPSLIGLLETGRSGVSDEVLEAIAGALKVPIGLITLAEEEVS